MISGTTQFPYRTRELELSEDSQVIKTVTDVHYVMTGCSMVLRGPLPKEGFLWGFLILGKRREPTLQISAIIDVVNTGGNLVVLCSNFSYTGPPFYIPRTLEDYGLKGRRSEESPSLFGRILTSINNPKFSENRFS